MPPMKHGLGRGLGALIPPGTPTAVCGVRAMARHNEFDVVAAVGRSRIFAND